MREGVVFPRNDSVIWSCPVTMRTRPSRRSPFDARMLAAADELFREFDNVPILDVIGALTAARRELAMPSTLPDPAAIAATARERLLASSSRAVA